MFAIEFQAKIKNGIIEIPRQYLTRLKDRVRVILLVEENSQKTKNLIEQLIAHPVRVKDFRPLKREQIYAK